MLVNILKKPHVFTQFKECLNKYIKLLAPDLHGVVRVEGTGKRIRGPTDDDTVSSL